MNIMKTLADQMIASQSFGFKSFQEAVATVEHQFRDKMLRITYDRLSMCIYSHNLTAKQFFTLKKNMNHWLLKHYSEDQKLRIEYGILFHYALLFPEFQNAQISKNLHPDFILSFGEQTIGVEVTRLEKDSDNIQTRILSENYKPGMTANEVFAKAFSKHGRKVREYEIFEINNEHVAIRHIESMLIIDDIFVKQIEVKIKKYNALAASFDKFILLCNAQTGITITSEDDARNMLDKVFEMYPDSRITIAVLFLNSNNVLCCVHSK